MRRLTPLLTNLGVVSVFRLVLPMTRAAGGERYLYYMMSLFFPYAKCPSYQCFRFLPAFIPSLLPSRRLFIARMPGANPGVFQVAMTPMPIVFCSTRSRFPSRACR